MKITVITVCYNEERDIKRTLDSVLNQTSTDFDYLICDGKSTDRTLEIIESYLEKFKEKGVSLTLYSEKDNGIYDAMNKAIDRAKGDYIVFINGGDNFSDNNAIEKVVEAANNADVKPDVIYGDFNYVYAYSPTNMHNTKSVVRICDHNELPKRISICHQSCFCSLESMKKYRFNTGLKICADYNYLLDVYTNGGVFLHVPVITADFYGGGISSKHPHKVLHEERKARKAHKLSFSLKYDFFQYFWLFKQDIIKLVYKVSVRLYSIFFKKFERIIPLNKNLWVFGAWGGNLYSDNTKALFEHINSNHKDIKCVWISKSNDVVNQVRKAGFKAYKELSLKGVWYAAIANAAFCTENSTDISRYLNSKTKIINLWHGMGIKAVGTESGWIKDKTKEEFDDYCNMCREKYGTWHWMCASEEAKQKYMRSFCVPEEMFYITGQPKDDAFVNVKSSPYIDEIRTAHPGAKVAVYLPTHRNFGKDFNVSDETSIETLKSVNEKLAEKNIVMIFKPHYHEFKKYQGYTDNFSNIIFATDKEKYGDVYTFLPVCDMLVTDYSGIMFGYLASGKPIIYFTYDYESYVSEDAGFCYDFDDITYGPVCKTWDEVIENMATITSDDYKEIREKQRARFCPYHDGQNCERVYNQVKKL